MKNKKILLINAPASEIKERHYEEPDMPRIGLAYLASFLRDSGFLCEIIDAKYQRLSRDNVLDIVNKKEPAAIGFTAMTTEIIDTGLLASKIKERFPSLPIAIGGPHASALPARTLEEFSGFDIACFGEGEHTFRDIALALRENKAFEEITGIAYRDTSGIVKQNEPRPFLENLDELPQPAWDMFSPAKKYPILGSRGCPFRCNFCMRVLGDRIRFRDPSLVVKEMVEVYDKYKPALFEFYDETFGVHKEKTGVLLDEIIASGLNRKAKWHIQTRVDMVNQDLLFRMKEAGCVWVGFGIESGNEKILKSTSKNITKEKAMLAVKMAKKAKLSTGGFFILGHPFETKDTIRDTIDFAVKLNTDTVSFGVMTPYPGTEVARMAEKEEGGYRLLSHNWSDYNKQTGQVLELEGVTKEALQKYQLVAYIKFYILNFSIRKFKNLVEFIDLKSIFCILFKRVTGLWKKG